MIRTLTTLINLLAGITLVGQCSTEIWSYEFDEIDKVYDDWIFLEGDGCIYDNCGWGHNELQWYTQDNTKVNDKTLELTAKSEVLNGSFFTSVALIGKSPINISSTGKIVLPIMMPHDKGVGLKIFMSKSNDPSSFIGNSELVMADIRNKGESKLKVGTNQNYQIIPRISNTEHSPQWNSISIEWDSMSISWFWNGHLIKNIANEILTNGEQFYIGISLSVGGYQNTNPSINTSFPFSVHLGSIRLFDLPAGKHISGPSRVINGEKNVQFIYNSPIVTTSLDWSWPDGLSGTYASDSLSIVLDWKNKGGRVSVSTKDTCGQHHYWIDVQTMKGLINLYTLYANETDDLLQYDWSSGHYDSPVENIDINGINKSNDISQYVRDSSYLYDVLYYKVDKMPALAELTDETYQLVMDVRTSSTANREIIIQFENDKIASPDNFPEGRHSRFITSTKSRNTWERLDFEFLDFLDLSVDDEDVNSVVILVSPNTLTNDTFYFDNLDIYGLYLTSIFEAKNQIEHKTVFPNPCSDYLNIGQKVKEYAIYTTQYKLMKKGKATNAAINVSEIPIGQYLIYFQSTSGAMSYARFIKI